MKRVLLASLFVGVLGLVAVVWIAAPRIAAGLRARLETELSAATGVPVQVGTLRLSIVPPRIDVERVRIGGAVPIADAGHVEASLAVVASLAERRPVVRSRIDTLAVDLTHLPPSEAQAEESAFPVLPALLLRTLEVDDAHLRFRMGKSVAHLGITRLVAEAGVARGAVDLTAAIEATGIAFERKAYRATIDVLRVEGRGGRDGVFVDRADLEGRDIMAHARAGDTPGTLGLSGAFTPSVLGVVVDELAVVGGAAHVEGALLGDLRAPVLDATLSVAGGSIGAHRLGDLVTRLYWAGTTMRFGDLRLVGAPGRVRGDVDLTIVHEVPLHAALEWDDVDLAGLLAVIGADVPFANVLNGRTTVHGALDPLDLDVQGSGRLAVAAGAPARPPATFGLAARVQAHALDARLEVARPPGNQLGTHFTLAGDRMGGSITLRAADVDALNAVLPRPVQTIGLAGAADGTATYDGTIDHPEVRGQLTVRDGALTGARLGRVDADFVIRRGRLETARTTLSGAQGRGILAGAVALAADADNDWRVQLEGLATEQLVDLARRIGGVSLPLAGGAVDGLVTCAGPWRVPDLRADVAVRAPRVVGEALSRLELRGGGRWPQWSAQLDASREPDERLSVSASGEAARRFQATIESTTLNLAGLRELHGGAVRGAARLEGRIGGSVARPDGTLQLVLDDLAIGDRMLGHVVAQADGAAGKWRLRSDMLNDSVHVDAAVELGGTRPYRAALRWDDADLTGLVSLDAALHVRSTGDLSLNGSLQALAAPTGALRVTQLEAYHEPIRFVAAEPIAVRFDRGLVRIDSLVLETVDGRLAVTGGGRLPAEFDFDVRGQGDLVYLDVLGGPVLAARGPFEVTARASHRPDRGWTLSGGATLHDADLDVGLPAAFTDIEADLRFTGSSVDVVRLDGRAGGGDVEVTGRIDLDHGVALGWSMREVSLSLSDGIEARASGRGEVSGPWQVLTVGGQIEIVKALYDQPIELANFLPWFRERIRPVPRVKPPATEVRLDLTIRAPDGLFVDNNVAKVEARGEVRVTGPTDKPSLLGTVDVLEGEVTFRNRRFTITSGSVIFDDPQRINPRLEVSAESLIVTSDADYVVSAVVSGTADEPRVRFEADDPRLSQNDVLSLVTFGRTTTETQGDEGAAMGVGDVVGLLPGEVEGGVRAGLRTLGVDRFEVEPAYVRSTGAIEPRVTIGKDISSRLRALASSSFGVDPRNTVMLEYRVTGRVSLLGDWESRTKSEAGAFGGDIKFRHEFRRWPFPFTLLGRPQVPAVPPP